MKLQAGGFALAALVGAAAALVAGAAGRSAEAQSVDNKTTRWLSTTVEFAQSQQAMLLFDSQTNRLMAYVVTPMKELELVAVREISYDLKAVTFGKQKPTVQHMKEDWERTEREEREKREKPPEKK